MHEHNTVKDRETLEDITGVLMDDAFGDDDRSHVQSRDEGAAEPGRDHRANRSPDQPLTECRGRVGPHAADVDLDPGALESRERAAFDLERAHDDDGCVQCYPRARVSRSRGFLNASRIVVAS